MWPNYMFVLCSTSMYYMLYIDYILRKENLDVHTEERTSSVWRVRGQVPPKHTAFCSFWHQHSLLFFLRHRHCNKNKQIPCIYRGQPSRIKRDIVASSIRCLRAVLCIYTYIYAIIASRFHSVPGSGTRVIITNSLKMILFLQKGYYTFV